MLRAEFHAAGLGLAVVLVLHVRGRRRLQLSRSMESENPPLTANWMSSPQTSSVQTLGWTESSRNALHSQSSCATSVQRGFSSSFVDFAWGLTRSGRKSGRDIQMSTSAQTHETALAEVVVFVVTHLPAGAVFKNRFVLGSERWRSSTSLMCAATLRGSNGEQHDVLLKLFACDLDFDREVEVTGKFQSLCPVVFGVYPASFDDPEYDEDRVPACIVIERPVCTLQEWLAQKDVDWLLSDQIATLYCIATMLKELHSKDLVLCDLSPTTIAWFDSGDKPPGWRLLTASQASRRGRHIRPVSMLRFAAPEETSDAPQVALSLRDAQGYVLVSPSIDVWALGVIGLAVFAGKRLFEPDHTDEQVKLMLCNEEPLPFEMDRGYWERIQPRAVAGLLRNLLQRKPLLRLPVDDVLRVIQTLAAPPPPRDREKAQALNGPASMDKLRSAEEVVMQLAPWPTTWSINFSDRLHSMSGAGSELNTEEQLVGRRQAQLLNAQLSANMASDVLDSQSKD